MSLLEVKNLTTRFNLLEHQLIAVEDISFSLEENEILAVVGESGCGKSVTALSLMKLIESPGEIDPQSQVLFQGQDILSLSDEKLQKIRGSEIAMIFQEPAASFNPLFPLGSQIAEALKIHRGTAKEEALKTAEHLLDQVRIAEANRRVKDYPFQLSGGMLQRAMTALAISCEPQILLADEPTTALDVTVQAQIINLLKEQVRRYNMSMIFVTHDLELIDGFADNLMLLYAGRIFEKSSSVDFFKKPLHPYGEDLMKAIPRMGLFKDEIELFTIKGQVPPSHRRPVGCTYAPRCNKCFKRCTQEEPPLFNIGERQVRCWLYNKEDQK
ncbi:MAG: ABC transporter ATP-binding protein [Spirochaetaceae bacterium]|jgi:peptide/nickel transport system ATP-binding protein|nr:ABC transporter ATP-binding protein [Spirochaetaceae bacterium]